MTPIIDKKETGNRIKFFMDINQYKPVDVQRFCNLTCVQTVYHWITGISVPKIEHLYMLSSLFNVDMDVLVCGDRDDFWEEKQVVKMRELARVMYEEDSPKATK